MALNANTGGRTDGRTQTTESNQSLEWCWPELEKDSHRAVQHFKLPRSLKDPEPPLAVEPACVRAREKAATLPRWWGPSEGC